MPPAMNSRSLPCKRGVNREAVAVGAADGDLLAGLHGVEPFGHAAALFNGKLHIFLQRGTGRDGEQRLADARHGEHGALAGDMDEGLFAVKADDAEGLDIRRVDADIRDDGDIGDQRIVISCVFLPKCFDDFDDVHMDGALGKAAAAADAAEAPVVIIREIDQLVHEALPEALELRRARLTGGHLREIRVHAAVPAAEAAGRACRSRIP